VDLCGHATLASAHVLFEQLGHPSDRIVFRSRRSGVLTATRKGGEIVLDFPADKLRMVAAPAGLVKALGRRPKEVWRGRTDLLCLFGSQGDIERMRPDFPTLAKIRARGVMVTAKGQRTDFVSRFFGPRVGVPEDPVTGSAHTTLTVFWARRLGKTKLRALQLSRRGGRLGCTLVGDRVWIAGKAKTFLVGTIELDGVGVK
jgi:PhzF family phenazine biosynthesis protein